MRILGLTITREKQLSHVGSTWRSPWRVVAEPWAGAWQQNQEETRGDLITYPTLYSCIMRITSDVGKLPFTLCEVAAGVSKVVENAAYSPVLRKPNPYQTEAQFREQWMLSKLCQGNAYILKRRDDRGVVVGLYVLDPLRTLPMVSEFGNVYYQLKTDALNTLPANYPSDKLIVPASEVIHDRCMAIHHPLIGVPPLAAAYWPALKNLKILRSATEFFANNAQPGGILTAPAGMTEGDAKQVQDYWSSNFTGTNAGRVAIVGADMKFTPFAMKSIDAQMVEQMRYSDEQICQPFGIPPFKVGIGTIPAGLGVDGLNQLYYADALQTHIEHMEGLLNEGLRIKQPLSVELALEPLLRMDEGKRADVETKLVAGKIKTPDEGRLRFNLAPTGGGDTLWGQHQDYPLGVLSKREDLNPVPPPAPSMPAEEPVDAEDENAKQLQKLSAWVATRKAIDAARRATNKDAT
jgi:HK97 family phage portal protein